MLTGIPPLPLSLTRTCVGLERADGHVGRQVLVTPDVLPGRRDEAGDGHVQPEAQAPVGAVLQPDPAVYGDDLGPAHLARQEGWMSVKPVPQPPLQAGI